MTSKYNWRFKVNAEGAEVIGIIYGDGSFYLDKSGKYHILVCFNKEETNYMYYVKELFERYFEGYKFYVSEVPNEFFLRNISRGLGRELVKYGVKTGNKTKNEITIPSWIYWDDEFVKAFLRGFFDSDGCVYRKYGSYVQIEIKLGSERTTESIRRAIHSLGIHVTSVLKQKNKKGISWRVYVYRQSAVHDFF